MTNTVELAVILRRMTYRELMDFAGFIADCNRVEDEPKDANDFALWMLSYADGEMPEVAE